MPGTQDAQETWKVFHKRKMIDWEKTVRGQAIWPDRWELAGRAVTTYYASDKWQKNRTFFERYYHDHDKTTRIWVPAGILSWATKEQPPSSPCLDRPGAVSVLGFYLGTDVLRPDQGPKDKPGKLEGEHGSLLVAHPGRHCLYVLERKKIVAIIWGPKLVVAARGVAG